MGLPWREAALLLCPIPASAQSERLFPHDFASSGAPAFGRRGALCTAGDPRPAADRPNALRSGRRSFARDEALQMATQGRFCDSGSRLCPSRPCGRFAAEGVSRTETHASPDARWIAGSHGRRSDQGRQVCRRGRSQHTMVAVPTRGVPTRHTRKSACSLTRRI